MKKTDAIATFTAKIDHLPPSAQDDIRNWLTNHVRTTNVFALVQLGDVFAKLNEWHRAQNNRAKVTQ